MVYGQMYDIPPGYITKRKKSLLTLFLILALTLTLTLLLN